RGAGAARPAWPGVVRDRSRHARLFGAGTVAARQGGLSARPRPAGRVLGAAPRTGPRRSARAGSARRARDLHAAPAYPAGLRTAAAAGDDRDPRRDPGPALVAAALRAGQGRAL